MTEIFADTSGWANGFVNREPFHTAAAPLIRLYRNGRTRVVTTNYILAELAALLISPIRLPHAQRVAIVETIRTSSWVEVVHVDASLDAEAWELLKARPDKQWSLVDCASFVIMQRRGITQALASDHHFEQAGFACLLQ